MTMTAQQVVKDEYGAEVRVYHLSLPTSTCIYLNMYILYIEHSHSSPEPYSLQVIFLSLFVKVLVSFGANPQDIDKENTILPDYLPEDPDSPKADSHSVARIKKDDKKSGWLSSAATFITNSFYW